MLETSKIHLVSLPTRLVPGGPLNCCKRRPWTSFPDFGIFGQSKVDSEVTDRIWALAQAMDPARPSGHLSHYSFCVCTESSPSRTWPRQAARRHKRNKRDRVVALVCVMPEMRGAHRQEEYGRSMTDYLVGKLPRYRWFCSWALRHGEHAANDFRERRSS